MTDLEHVAKLMGLNIFQSADSTYITNGQGEYSREMLEKLRLEDITLVLPLLSLISRSNMLTVFLKLPQTLTKNSCVESTIYRRLVTYCRILTALDQTSHTLCHRSHVSQRILDPSTDRLSEG